MKPITLKGYEHLYKVNKLGEVYSVRQRKVLKPFKDRHGYLQVCVCKTVSGETLKHWPRVHRLVCEAYLKNPKGKPQVNHKDMNRQNNILGNLEWVTNSENKLHGIKNKGVKNGKIRF